MVRGGGWNNNGDNLRSANRNRNTTDDANNNLGFRLASTPAPAGVAHFTECASAPAGAHAAGSGVAEGAATEDTGTDAGVPG